MKPGLTQPRFIGAQAALAMHDLLIAQFGGAAGARDIGLLEAALAQASAGVAGEYLHEFPFGMAAAYAFHIAMNHPFVDGNKRVSLMVAGAFLRMNGWNLTSEGTAAADAILAVVDGTMSKEALTEWFRSNSRERPRFELRDFFSHVTHAMLREAQKASVVMGKRTQEFDASLDEAEQALPLLRGIRAEAAQHFLAGRHEDLARCGVEMSMLMHLYRIAEDSGYQW